MSTRPEIRIVYEIKKLREMLGIADVARLERCCNAISQEIIVIKGPSRCFDILCELKKAAGLPVTERMFELRCQPDLFLQVVGRLFEGDGVSLERRRKRVLQCLQCPYLREGNEPACGCCLCSKRKSWRDLVRLAKHEETADHGCRHPTGSRWKLIGV